MINIQGLSLNDPLPGTFLQVLFGQGPVSAGFGVRRALLIANKLPGGTAQAGVLYGPDTDTQLLSSSDVRVLGGSGSEGARGYDKFVKANPITPVYMLFVAESAGAAASATLTIVGTASANSTVRVRVGADFVEVPIVLGDTPTVQAAAIAAAINNRSELGVSASAALGVVTVSAKQKGVRGNDIRLSAQYLLPSTSTITASSPKLTGGTTADDVSSALAAIDSKNFAYILSALNDTTNAGLVASHVDSQAAPLVGNRQRAIFASTGALASAITLSTALNAARETVLWQKDSDLTPFELACAAIGAISFKEIAFGSDTLNFSGFGALEQDQNSWKVPAPVSGSQPTRAEQASAINSGVSPVVNTSGGRTKLVKLITSKYLNGSVTNYSVRDWHFVSVSDAFAGEMFARLEAPKFKGKTISANPVGAASPAQNSVFPNLLRAEIVAAVNVYDARGLLKNVDDIKRSIQTPDIAPSDPPNRLTGAVGLQVISICDQIGLQISEVSASIA